MARGRRIVDALSSHEHRAAVGLFAVFVLAYLWPVLVGGKSFAPESVLYSARPWSAVVPPGLQYSINGHLADAAFSYYPFDVIARHLLRAGTFPAWNPYALAGTPFFGNFQVAWLSPFSLPLWILPLNYGLGVAAALKLWVAGFGTYLLARELRLGFWPGIVAGASFTLCAFNVVWLAHGVFVSVAAMLPWGLWLVERLVRRGRPVEGLALAGVVAVVQTGGHPGTQLHVMAGFVLYALVRTATTTGAGTGDRMRRLGIVAAALGIGSLLAAVVLLPAQLATQNTIGVLTRRNGAPTLGGSHMPFHALRTALFPDWWGRPSELGASPAPASYRERTFYAGGVSLVLALIALVSPGGWRRKAPFSVLVLLGALVAVRTPVRSLVVRLPLFDQVQDQRILLWFVFGVAMLAAFGLQAVLEHEARRRQWAVVGVAVLAGVVAALGVGIHGRAIGGALRHAVDRGDTAAANALALASAAWWILLVLACAGALLVIRRRPGAGAALLTAIVALDMLHFAHGYQAMVPARTALPPAPPAIAFLQRHQGDRRIAALGEALPADSGAIYGLRDVRGRDIPQPTLRYCALWARVGEAEPGTIARIAQEGPRVLGLLGARYLLAGPHVQASIAGFTPVYRGRDGVVYRNAFAVPRASVVSHVFVARELDEEVVDVADGSFDPRHDAVVRASQAGHVELPAGGATGTVRVTSESDAHVTLQATLRQAGLVVLDDAWERGWTVRVDGRPAQAMTADVVLRGVVVPRGAHTISWSYSVPGLASGALLSGLGLLLCVLWGGWLAVRTRRARTRPLRR